MRPYRLADSKALALGSSFKHIPQCISLQLRRSSGGFQSSRVFGDSHQVRAMIEKSVFLDELGRCQKARRCIRHASLWATAGIAALPLLIGATVGTAQELPAATQDTASEPFDPSEASGSGSARASINRSSSGGISDAAAATQFGQTGPGQWLIDDVAREHAKFKAKQASPNPITAITPDTGTDDAALGSRSPGNRRAGGHERGREEVTGSIGRAPVSGVGDPPTSESRTGAMATEAEDGRPSTPPSRRSLKRWDEHGASPRPNTSHGPDDVVTNCVEAPVGQAPEGEHWYYRLDRGTHRKCWYVRAHRQDESRGSFVANGQRLPDRTPADPLDAAWAWWYRR